MSEAVVISFECLPLRSVGRLDIPIDASPAYRARCEQIKQAIERHGSHNTYFLSGGQCSFRLTNHLTIGLLDFSFSGVVLTDTSDTRTQAAHLEVHLERETCDWLTAPVVEWFQETTLRAVALEFDRYIAAGDLQRTIERLKQLESQVEATGGFMGMNV